MEYRIDAWQNVSRTSANMARRCVVNRPRVFLRRVCVLRDPILLCARASPPGAPRHVCLRKSLLARACACVHGCSSVFACGGAHRANVYAYVACAGGRGGGAVPRRHGQFICTLDCSCACHTHPKQRCTLSANRMLTRCSGAIVPLRMSQCIFPVKLRFARCVLLAACWPVA
jgi:hypothetical protein